MTWSEDAARALSETFDGTYGAPGVVTAAACIDEPGTAIAASPGVAPADGRFEIGSITKTMTATLLALLAADGTLALDDEVSRWLPAGQNGEITLRQLATHTSGLPRLAPNHSEARTDPASPYALFGPGQAAFQGQVSPGQIHQGLREETRDLGPAGDVQVTCQRWPGAGIVADLTITFARGTRAGQIHFDPSGQVAGLRFLPPSRA